MTTPPKAPPYAGIADPEGFEPFGVGYVELPDQVKVEARLTVSDPSALRIGMGMAAGFVLSAAFGFTGPERIAFVLQCAMPVAVYNYLFAEIYRNEPNDVASLVIVSTLMSVVTTPILLAVIAK